MPGSCSSGFRSRPSAAAGNSRSKGLDVSSTNSRKPTLSRPITTRMRASTGAGRWRLKLRDGRASSPPASAATAASSLRGCPSRRRCGRAAAARSSSASATLSTEKSLCTKQAARQKKPNSTRPNAPARPDAPAHIQSRAAALRRRPAAACRAPARRRARATARNDRVRRSWQLLGGDFCCDHASLPARPACWACFNASAASGGM